MTTFGTKISAAQPGDASTVLVSVIIVNWNARDYLLQCLQSLSPEVCRYPMEIIVVDNESSDGSPEAVEKKFPNVRMIRAGSNLGFAKANNLGVSHSRGRYLAFVNSDVKVLNNCLTTLVEHLEQHSEAGMAGPRVIGGDGKVQRSCRGFPTVWNMLCRALALDAAFPRARIFSGFALQHWPQDTLRSVDILSGCFWLVRRESLEKVGLLDESFFMYGEDMDWCKRFWNAGWKVVFVPTAEAVHYGGASSANSPVRFYIERQRADLQYWKKHHSAPAVACYFLISCLHLALRSAGYALVSTISGRKRAACAHKTRRSLACLRWMLSGHFPAQSAANKT